LSEKEIQNITKNILSKEKRRKKQGRVGRTKQGCLS
jgi:hypothetical protein